MEPETGFEPVTCCLQDSCSSQLSYSGGTVQRTVGSRSRPRVLDRRDGAGNHEAVELTHDDHAILAFEQGWWHTPGPKADAIRARLSMSPSAYYRRLDSLIDKPAAASVDPLLVKRLRRARADRRRTRFSGPQWKRTRS